MYFGLYANKLDNLDEMDKILEKYKIPKWYKEETRNLETKSNNKKIEIMVQDLFSKK